MLGLVVFSLVIFGITATSVEEGRFKQLEYRLSILEQENAELETKVNKLQQYTADEFVGFSASLNNDVTNVIEGGLVRFDNVLVNNQTDAGVGYNPDVGIFTCPFTGTYLSSLNVITTEDQDFNGRFVYASDSGRGRVLAQTGSTPSGNRLSGHATASETLLIRCTMGANIRIEGSGLCTENQGCGLDKASRWTMFWIHSG